MTDQGCCRTERTGDDAKEGCCSPRAKMHKNVGMFDRLLRMAIGTVLVTMAATGDIGPWGYVGIAPMGSAVIGMCGLYRVLGINTCKTGHCGTGSCSTEKTDEKKAGGCGGGGHTHP